MNAFTTPSQAEVLSDDQLLRKGDLFDGLGRRRIIHPDYVGEDNPKLVSYTRVTTFIDAIEDKTNLEKWRTRLILEGAPDIDLEARVMDAQARHQNEISDIELSHSSDGAKAAEKAVEAAGKAYRKELNDLADEAFHHAGGHDGADYGTALHEMVEAYHRNGNELSDDEIASREGDWPGIGMDFVAYEEAWEQFEAKTGARIVDLEVMVVNDKMKLSGRTDIIALARFPGEQRARRIIIDLKTQKSEGDGSKWAQQLDIYANAKLYDPETGKRSPMRTRRDIAIVVHLKRGSNKAIFYMVKLAPGRMLNGLCAKVRQARRKIPNVITVMGEDDAQE